MTSTFVTAKYRRQSCLLNSLFSVNHFGNLSLSILKENIYYKWETYVTCHRQKVTI